MLFVFRKYPRAQIAPILDLYCKNLHQTLIVLQFLFISLKFSLSPPNGQSSKRESHAICFSQVPAGEVSESVPRFKMSMRLNFIFLSFISLKGLRQAPAYPIEALWRRLPSSAPPPLLFWPWWYLPVWSWLKHRGKPHIG